MFGDAELPRGIAVFARRKTLGIDPYNSGGVFQNVAGHQRAGTRSVIIGRPASRRGPARETVQIIGGWKRTAISPRAPTAATPVAIAKLLSGAKWTETAPCGRGAESALQILSHLQSRDQRERLVSPHFSHVAGSCSARTRACRVETLLDTLAGRRHCVGAARRHECRRGTYECVRHVIARKRL